MNPAITQADLVAAVSKAQRDAPHLTAEERRELCDWATTAEHVRYGTFDGCPLLQCGLFHPVRGFKTVWPEAGSEFATNFDREMRRRGYIPRQIVEVVP